MHIKETLTTKYSSKTKMSKIKIKIKSNNKFAIFHSGLRSAAKKQPGKKMTRKLFVNCTEKLRRCHWRKKVRKILQRI